MRARGIVAVLATLAVMAAACSNSSDGKAKSTTTSGSGSSTTVASGGGSASDQPGVTPTTIRVGGVVSKTNPLNGPYASAFDGVNAYFAMVNSEGGVYGRQLKLVAERDDQVGQNQEQVQALLSQDNVFAALPMATIFSFSGAKELAAQSVPTFGWNINDEWADHPTLYGSNAGAICNGCVGSYLPFVARQLHKKKIGVLAYSVQNSAQCADGISKSFKAYPSADVAFVTKSLEFGTTDFSVEVSQMKDKGVDFVMTCMDTTATLNLAKEMRKQGLDATQYLPNGYDQKFIAANKEFFQNDVVGVSFAPFETRPRPPGLAQFDTWMRKGSYTQNENAINGWINAAMFVSGLKAAGPSFTRAKVVDALNKMTSMTVDGLIEPPRNWTTDHAITHNLACTAYVQVKDGKFVPIFTQPGKPFMCLPDQPKKLPAKATNL